VCVCVMCVSHEHRITFANNHTRRYMLHISNKHLECVLYAFKVCIILCLRGAASIKLKQLRDQIE